jgi:superfamily II DNA or RNA helicase
MLRAVPSGDAATSDVTKIVALNPNAVSLTAQRLDPPEIAPLMASLETRHGRPLSTKEKSITRELVLAWHRVIAGGVLYPRDLRALGIGESGYYFSDPEPVLSEWKDALQSSGSPLEFWQYLALYAERNRIPVPEVLRPLTDTSAVRNAVEARERAQTVERWKALFAQESETPTVQIAETLPKEIRLKLTTPRLTWEFRDDSNGAWQIARGPRAKTWFDLIATGTTENAGALILLQEVRLRRMRADLAATTEVQNLRIEDKTTREILRWMLQSALMRSLLVDFRGDPFTADAMPLRWEGRPAIGRGDDVRFDLIDAQGAAAPTDLIDLGGDPPLAVSGHTVYQMPSPIAEGAPRGVIVPREALDPRSTAALRRRGVRFQDVVLPRVEIVVLRPRFLCALQSRDDDGETLLVSIHALDRKDRVVSERRDGLWTNPVWPEIPREDNTIEEAEFSLADAALAFLGSFNLGWSSVQQSWTRRASTKAFPEEFAAWVRTVREAGVEVLTEGDLAGLARFSDLARLEVQAKPVGDDAGVIDWFDLEVAVRTEDHTLTPEEVKLLLKAKGKFVRLPGKGWRRLQIELEHEEGARLAELGVDVGALTPGGAPQRFHALQLADERIAGLLPEAHAARVRARAERLRTIAAPTVPVDLRTELRPYQKDGYHFLAHLSSNGLGGILADDMGLGKTVQAIAWLLWLKDQVRTSAQRGIRALVVCPKSVVSNWELEIARFAPALTTAALANGEAPKEVHVTVSNYAQLRLSAASLVGRTWDAVILDEGQNIKNPQSQTARVARELRAAHRLVLTGTPIENRALDLWSLFAFAMPGLLGSQASFKRMYGERADALARARLGRRVRHFLLRRTKAQVAADLPPRIEEDLLVELDGVQRALYDAELKRTRSLLLGVQSDAEFSRQRFSILQSLLRLRQICCDPRLLGIDAGTTREGATDVVFDKPAVATPGENENSVASLIDEEAQRRTTGSAKLEALFDTLEPLIEEGHRVLVFSQFVSLLGLVAKEMKARRIKFLLLTGQTENRQALVDRFQSPEGESVFLLSLKAAGTGLNLTAASYVVLLDPWWNPAVEAQAIDRTHRIGQTNPVIAYRLLARGTIEEKIRLLQRSKSELARTIVQEESVATVMSIDDLRFVLGE